MHLVGFTIEIYSDARPYERQIYKVQVKVKFTLEQATKAQRAEYRYNTLLFI